LAREECPETADFSLQSKAAEEESAKRRKTQPVNEFYKIAICKHWEKLGTCPFGDECHFAHGEKDLRPFPGKDKENVQKNNAGPKGFDAQSAPPVVPPLSLPDDNKRCKYFIFESFRSVSMRKSRW
jgi:hypothetical protein